MLKIKRGHASQFIDYFHELCGAQQAMLFTRGFQILVGILINLFAFFVMNSFSEKKISGLSCLLGSD